MSPLEMESVVDLVKDLNFDICVLTGDYRAKTYGPIQPCLVGMARVVARVRKVLGETVYNVLGNHDTIRMVPDLERMGVMILLNERVILEREGDHIYIAGIDDAHFYRVDNIEKAATGIPDDVFSILLSHTSEIYRRAARGFRSPAKWPHPRRADMFSARDPDYVRLQSTTRFRLRGMEIREHGRLYVSWRRFVHCAGAVQLSSRNHASSSASRRQDDLTRIRRTFDGYDEANDAIA